MPGLVPELLGLGDVRNAVLVQPGVMAVPLAVKDQAGADWQP
jgi:hypothetical protein